MASKHLRDAGIDPERVLSSALQAALGENEPPKRRHPGRVLAVGAAVAAAAAAGQKRMPRVIKVPLRMGLHRLEHKLSDAVHVDDLTSRVDDLAGSVRERLAGHDGEPRGDEVDDEPLAEEDLDAEDTGDGDELDDEPRDDVDSDEPDDDEADDDEPEDEGGSDDEPDDGDGPRDEADDAEPDEDEPDEEDDETADAGPDDGQEPDDEDEEDDEDEQIAARSLRSDDQGDARRSGDDAPDLFQALLAPRPRPTVMRRGARGLDPSSQPPKPGRPKSRKSKTARA